MNRLKSCPFCGTLPQANSWIFRGISETRYFCPNQECPLSVRTVTLEEWQTRPLEDALLARAERAEQKQREAESMVERLFEAGERLSIHSRMVDDIDSWNALVAEWQARNE